MTDARFPDRWLLDRRIDALNDRDFRSFVSALTWSVSNQTDGRVEESDLGRIPHFSRESVGTFVAVELWEVTDNGHEIHWKISDFADTQTCRGDMESMKKVRAANRRKQSNRRARRAKEQANVAGYVPGYTERGTTQARTGQARTGPNATELDNRIVPPGDE